MSDSENNIRIKLDHKPEDERYDDDDSMSDAYDDNGVMDAEFNAGLLASYHSASIGSDPVPDAGFVPGDGFDPDLSGEAGSDAGDGLYLSSNAVPGSDAVLDLSSDLGYGSDDYIDFSSAVPDSGAVYGSDASFDASFDARSVADDDSDLRSDSGSVLGLKSGDDPFKKATTEEIKLYEEKHAHVLNFKQPVKPDDAIMGIDDLVHESLSQLVEDRESDLRKSEGEIIPNEPPVIDVIPNDKDDHDVDYNSYNSQDSLSLTDKKILISESKSQLESQSLTDEEYAECQKKIQLLAASIAEDVKREKREKQRTIDLIDDKIHETCSELNSVLSQQDSFEDSQRTVDEFIESNNNFVNGLSSLSQESKEEIKSQIEEFFNYTFSQDRRVSVGSLSEEEQDAIPIDDEDHTPNMIPNFSSSSPENNSPGPPDGSVHFSSSEEQKESQIEEFLGRLSQTVSQGFSDQRHFDSCYAHAVAQIFKKLMQKYMNTKQKYSENIGSFEDLFKSTHFWCIEPGEKHGGMNGRYNNSSEYSKTGKPNLKLMCGDDDYAYLNLMSFMFFYSVLRCGLTRKLYSSPEGGFLSSTINYIIFALEEIRQSGEEIRQSGEEFSFAEKMPSSAVMVQSDGEEENNSMTGDDSQRSKISEKDGRMIKKMSELVNF